MSRPVRRDPGAFYLWTRCAPRRASPRAPAGRVRSQRQDSRKGRPKGRPTRLRASQFGPSIESASEAVALARVWPYRGVMTSPSIKATYSLDAETVAALDALARRWGLPKSAALRRVIREAAGGVERDVTSRLEALDDLQRSLTADAARAWADEVRDERRASTREAPRGR